MFIFLWKIIFAILPHKIKISASPSIETVNLGSFPKYLKNLLACSADKPESVTPFYQYRLLFYSDFFII